MTCPPSRLSASASGVARRSISSTIERAASATQTMPTVRGRAPLPCTVMNADTTTNSANASGVRAPPDPAGRAMASLSAPSTSSTTYRFTSPDAISAIAAASRALSSWRQRRRIARSSTRYSGRAATIRLFSAANRLTAQDGTVRTAVVMSSWSPAVVSEPRLPSRANSAIADSDRIRRTRSEVRRARGGSGRASMSTSAASHTTTSASCGSVLSARCTVRVLPSSRRRPGTAPCPDRPLVAFGDRSTEPRSRCAGRQLCLAVQRSPPRRAGDR